MQRAKLHVALLLPLDGIKRWTHLFNQENEVHSDEIFMNDEDKDTLYSSRRHRILSITRILCMYMQLYTAELYG